MFIFAIDFSEPVILEDCGVKKPGHEVALKSEVNEIGGDGAHLPQDPQVDGGDVHPCDESCPEQFFLADMTVVNLDHGMVRVIA